MTVLLASNALMMVTVLIIPSTLQSINLFALKGLASSAGMTAIVQVSQTGLSVIRIETPASSAQKVKIVQ
jgi:hypothetical protein